MADKNTRHIHVAVIGTGFGGVGTGIRLIDEGIDDFLIFERASEIGGTWHANTYPGAQCDIPSALYSFSFAPNPDWTRLYPLQHEIKAYITKCAADHGVTGHILFEHDVTDAQWDETSQVWTIRAGGSDFTADVLVGATGPFSEPSVPDIPGLDEFDGEVFHSADWNHDWTPEGKRTAVIGTGASAVQFVPQIQPEVDELLVFQRTPTWILPHPDRPVHPRVRAVFRRVPLTQRLVRETFGLAQESLVPGLLKRQWMLAPLAAAGRWNLKRQVADSRLREKLTPGYAFGCKRPTFSNKFYPALAASNADVITSGIRRVTATGIETEDSVVHEVDTIILGTGFKLAGNEGFQRIRRADGRSLSDVWAGGEMVGYMGTNVTGFPNYFQILGPNSVIYTSQVVTIEAQIDYLVDALTKMRDQGIRSIDVTETAQREFVEHVDDGLSASVWNTGGCSSYYLSPSGRNYTYWPGFAFGFRRRMKRVDLADYDLRHVGPNEGAVAARTTDTELAGR